MMQTKWLCAGCLGITLATVSIAQCQQQPQQTNPASVTPGSVSGHIYQAETEKPLVGAIVTLQGTVVNLERSQRTSADGSYAFGGIIPGGYWITAYRSDPSGRKDLGPHSTSVFVVPGQKVNAIDMDLAAGPKITTIADGPIVATYADRNVSYELARFSPDGAILAVVTDDPIDSPIGPYEVWLYDMRSHRCVPAVTTPPLNTNSSPVRLSYVVDPHANITGLAWADDGTLYVDGLDLKVAATLGGAKEINQFPPEITEVLQPIGIAPHQSRNKQFAVTVRGDRGAFQLSVGRSDNAGTVKEIAQGSWELLSYLFDLDRSLVFYPKEGINGAIVTFDLTTRKSRELSVPFGINFRLQDRTKDGTVAYTVTHRCMPGQASGVSDNERLQPNPIRPNQTQRTDNFPHLCFVDVQ